MEKLGGYTVDPEIFYGEDTDVARRLNKVGKVKFTFKLPIKSSGRRLAKEGGLTIALRYSINYFWIILFQRPFTKTAEEDVRLGEQGESGVCAGESYKGMAARDRRRPHLSPCRRRHRDTHPSLLLKENYGARAANVLKKAMTLRHRATIFLLFLGDVAALYAALLLTLALRYGGGFYGEFVNVHFAPFTIIFVPWLLVFYIAGLYDLRRLRNNLDFLKTLSLTLVTNAFIAVLIFYLVPSFGIAPKTNLFIFFVIFAVVEIWWRRLFNRVTESAEAPNTVLLVGDGRAAAEAEKTVSENKQFGYAIRARLDEGTAERSPAALERMARESGANLIVVPREMKQNNALAAVLYRLFGDGASVMDLESFYEFVTRKVPLDELGETWFLENIEHAAHFYDPLKRAVELLFAVAIGIVLLPLEMLIALIVVLTSRGPAIYRQERVGRNGAGFTLYKFRTMRTDAERNGAQWAAKNDARVTLFGKFLRATHLDELPQLWNVIRGDLSFVGPRPERPEFVAKLKTQVPFYEMRLLVTPGVTGWAQIHYRADLTVEDVKQKLQYDIYYLKNRSPILDLAIILKTLKSLFVNPE